MKTRRIYTIALSLCLAYSAMGEPLTLDSCLSLARQNNRELQSAALSVDRAKEVKAQARTKYYPQVSGMAMGYHSLQPLVEVGIDDLENASARELLTALYGNYGAALVLPSRIGMLQYGYTAGVTALQPVYVGGKIVTGNRLAQLGVEAAELQQQIAERDKLETVEESYWLVVGLRDKQASLNTTTHLLDTISYLVDKAVAAGIAIPSDRLQVEMRRSEIARTQVQLSNGIALATRALCQSIGIAYSDTLELASDSLQNGSAECLDAPTGNILPENELLALQTKAAQLEYRLTLADALPQVVVGATYGYGRLQADMLRDGMGSPQGNGAVVVSVRIPLTGWCETGHKLKEHSLKIEQARLDQEEKNELLTLRSVQVRDQLTEAEWMLRETDLALTKAQENYRLAELNYQAGLNTISDLLTAQALLSKAENDCTDAKITYRVRQRRYRDLNCD